jgi:plastocyanin
MKLVTLRNAAALGAALALAVPAASEDRKVVQKDKSFSQPEIVVKEGDRIVFSNQDTVSHNLFSRSDGFQFEIKVQLPGQDSAVSFDRAGTAEVRCAIHPEMKLRVVVEPKEKR